PGSRVRDVEPPAAIEDRIVGTDQIVSAGLPGEHSVPAVGLDADHAGARVTHVEAVIEGRECQAAVEAAELSDGLDLARVVDPVALARLAAGPEGAVAVESEAFGMVETRGEDLELLDRHFRMRHRGVSWSRARRGGLHGAGAGGSLLAVV